MAWFGYSVNEQIIGVYDDKTLYQRVFQYKIDISQNALTKVVYFYNDYDTYEVLGGWIANKKTMSIALSETMPATGILSLWVNFWDNPGNLLVPEKRCYSGHGNPFTTFIYINGVSYTATRDMGLGAGDGWCIRATYNVKSGDAIQYKYTARFRHAVKMFLTYTDNICEFVYNAVDLTPLNIDTIVEHRAFMKSSSVGCVPVSSITCDNTLECWATPSAIKFKSDKVITADAYSILRYTKR